MDEDIKKEPIEGEVSEEKTEERIEPEQISETPKKVEDDKFITFLSYIGILCIIPLLTKKDDEFVFFHAKQGLVLLIVEVITAFIAYIPLFGWVIAPMASFLWIALSIIGIINITNGKKKELPILGKYAGKIKI